MRALLFETNPETARSIANAMERAKFPTDLMDPRLLHGLDQEQLGLDAYGAVILGDIACPIDIVATLRQCNLKAAIIPLLPFRNARQSADLLAAGADDVVVKPINGDEMAARIRAILRRGFGENKSNLQIGDLTIFLDGRDPDVKGRRLKLSHREHSIFMHLAQQSGRVVSKESVYNAVYGTVDMLPHDKVIDVYICKLRKKIADATGGQQYIETVYGRGYKFDLPQKTSAGRTRFGKACEQTPAIRLPTMVKAPISIAQISRPQFQKAI
ncbi:MULTISPECIES: response regulator transcription factor [unclassified Iodidimonas]|jgi:two-component system cell cycle response regulator CtrA|uniref:response regulator transcription factor n=1 Tax=unclassified Iodidimonas TaxID=2626145 RepID=UPI00248265DE|nr:MULTISPECIES: response regulator transcription factor [unclassified Iodidimonas]